LFYIGGVICPFFFAMGGEKVEIPANPSVSWIIGILISAIVAMAGLIAFILKYYLTNYVPKSTYEKTCEIIKNWEKRCHECEFARSEKLEQIYKLLGEINSLENLLVQSLAGINNSLTLLLSKSSTAGGALHDEARIRFPVAGSAEEKGGGP